MRKTPAEPSEDDEQGEGVRHAAVGVSEFWQRWQISLSTWLCDDIDFRF